MTAFHVFDLDASQRVFAVCGTSTRVLALHEQLGLSGGGAGQPFYRVVESPYEDYDDDFTRLRACEITLDRNGSTAAWRGDGHTVYEAHGTVIPRTHSHRVRDLDDAADPRRSQPLARRAGHERAVAPVPCTRGRRVSRRRERGPNERIHKDSAIPALAELSVARGRGFHAIWAMTPALSRVLMSVRSRISG